MPAATGCCSGGEEHLQIVLQLPEDVKNIIVSMHIFPPYAGHAALLVLTLLVGYPVVIALGCMCPGAE